MVVENLYEVELGDIILGMKFILLIYCRKAPTETSSEDKTMPWEILTAGKGT